jgi:hypothetical protein
VVAGALQDLRTLRHQLLTLDLANHVRPRQIPLGLGLIDHRLELGVRNIVGQLIEVRDLGSVLNARCFYRRQLHPGVGGSRMIRRTSRGLASSQNLTSVLALADRYSEPTFGPANDLRSGQLRVS